MPPFQCQANKRVMEMIGERVVPVCLVRCLHDEKHDGNHWCEYKGLVFDWPRGKQASPYFLLRRKAAA